VDLGDSRKSECPYIRESTKWRALQVVIAMVTIFTVQKFTCREYTRRGVVSDSLAADRRYIPKLLLSVLCNTSLFGSTPLLLWTAEGIFSGAGHASKIATSMKRVITFCSAHSFGTRPPLAGFLTAG
jgi:hypothetical protein